MMELQETRRLFTSFYFLSVIYTGSQDSRDGPLCAPVKGMVSRAGLEIETRRLVNELMDVGEIVQIEVGRRVKAHRWF